MKNFSILTLLLAAFLCMGSPAKTPASAPKQIVHDQTTYLIWSANLLNEKNIGTSTAKRTCSFENGKARFILEAPWQTHSIVIQIPEENKKKKYSLMVNFDLTAKGCVRGKQAWQNARLELFYLDQNRKKIPFKFDMKPTLGTKTYRDISNVYQIPENAAFLEVKPANYCSSGTLDISNLEIMFVSRADGKHDPGVYRMEKGDRLPPDGSTQKAVFTLDDAWHQNTKSREEYSLNGLWQFYPCWKDELKKAIPAQGSGWGYFKVPGHWQGRTTFGQPCANATPFYLSPETAKKMPKELHAGWYRRVITIPASWKGKMIRLKLDNIQSRAAVFANGKKIDQLEYPAGICDLTQYAVPGRELELAILVEAPPKVIETHMGATRTYRNIEELWNKGLCGEARLEAVPREERISDVAIRTSVAKKQMTLDIGFETIPAGKYQIRASVSGPDSYKKEFASKTFETKGGSNIRIQTVYDWIAPKLWDTDCPQNKYLLTLSLCEKDGRILDTLYPEEFGFREFTVNGRNFLLNGKIIHLRAIQHWCGQASAHADKPAIEHLIKMMKAFNVNYLIDGDYTYTPGKCAYADYYRKLTSDHGILTSITMPISLNFKGMSKNRDLEKKYRRMAEYRLRRYQNIPGLVMMATSHNYAGYGYQFDPLKLGNGTTPEKAGDFLTNPRRIEAVFAEKILTELEPSRPVYHHDAGQLGKIHVNNQYQNWSPIQERSDWLELWEKSGNAPLMFLEYGLPHIASWSSARGEGGFIWSAFLLQCFWHDEFHAETVGEDAYAAEPAKTKYFLSKYINNRQLSNKPTWHNYIETDQLNHVRGIYTKHNIRDMRARGLSGLLPWDTRGFMRPLTESIKFLPNPDRFKHLKQPGFVADYKPGRFPSGFTFYADQVNPYEFTETGKALSDMSQDILVWIGGKKGDFTERSSHFSPGETIRKSICILNDSRRDQNFHWKWNCGKHSGEGTQFVSAGTRAEIPIEFPVDRGQSGSFMIHAQVNNKAKSWNDQFQGSIIIPEKIKLNSKVGLYDPEGTAAPLLKRLGVKYETVKSEADLNGIQLLIIGRFGLDTMPFQLEKRLNDGLKLFVLEQRSLTLGRLGLRYNEQGLRELFPVGKQPLGNLTWWRGSSTSLKPYQPGLLNYPVFFWNGFRNKHINRAGNRGNISAILIEKPSLGNWLPLYQGGFDLQFAPLLLFSEGKGQIMFCQLEVSGRTEVEPQADRIFGKALEFLDKRSNIPTRKVWYSGDKKLAEKLADMHIQAEPLDVEKLKSEDLLVLAANADIPKNLNELIKDGLNVLCCEMTGDELRKIVPGLKTERKLRVSDYVSGLDRVKEFEGLGNSELHYRYGQTFDGFPENSNGGPALQCRKIGKGRVVMMQLAPWHFNPEIHATRTTIRRLDFQMMRLLANLGAEFKTGFFGGLNGYLAGNVTHDLPTVWRGRQDLEKVGKSQLWYLPDMSLEKWEKIKVGSSFQSQKQYLRKYNGWYWYRIDFDLQETFRRGDFHVDIGPVDDESWIWLNGKFVGAVTQKTNPKNYWLASRKVQLSPDKLVPGKQTIVILCNDLRGEGGVMGTPAIRATEAKSFYTDIPVAKDDPYRYYHW